MKPSPGQLKIASVIAAPASRLGSESPSSVIDRDERVAEPVFDRGPCFR